MKKQNYCRLIRSIFARREIKSTAAGAAMLLALSAVAQDQVLETMRVGDTTYSNVVVYNKTRTDIFVKCAGGMANIKVRDLDLETQELLGYDVSAAKRSRQPSVAQQIQSDPRFKEMQAMVAQQVTTNLQKLDQKMLWMIGTGAALLYIFFCYCCMLICQKTGFEPGGMVWLPILQAFPLLKAAGMPAWWFLWFLLPVLNLVPVVVWCVKIAKARKKTFLTALMLMLPVTNFLAFLYLAFSEGEGVQENQRPMALTFRDA